MLELKEITQQLVHKRTGEILAEKTMTIRTRPEVPFRSITDLKGYQDAEVYHPDDSVLETEGYEPLAETIRRCTVERHGRVSVDITKLPVTQPVYYDEQLSGKTAEEQMEMFDQVVNPEIDDPTDINAHAERVVEQLNSALEKAELSTTQQAQAPSISQAPADAVVNSTPTQAEKTE